MSRVFIVKLISLANGEATEFDGEYLVEYEPDHTKHEPLDPYNMWIRTTIDPKKALRLDFTELWNVIRKSYGLREDGEPNRPLTAFHIAFESAPMEDKE